MKPIKDGNWKVILVNLICVLFIVGLIIFVYNKGTDIGYREAINEKCLAFSPGFSIK